MKVPVTRCINCGGRIIWTLDHRDVPLPVDAKPRTHGYLRLEKRKSTPGRHVVLVARHESAAQSALWGEDSPRYTNHARTCAARENPKEKT